MKEDKKIRLIAVDLDGTLFDNNKEILPFTKEVLCRAMEQGIYLVPSTGRPIGSIPDNVAEIPGIQYMICSNGAAVYKMPERKRIYEKILTRSTVERIRSFERKPEIAMEAFIRGVPYAEAKYVKDPAAFGATAYGVTYVQSTRKPIEDWDGFLREHEEEFDTFSFASKDYEALAAFQERMLAEISEIYAVWSFTHLLEVGHIDSGKGETLLHLLESLAVSPDEAMAFGDAENDATMLSAVRYGIAMGNAVKELKDSAFDVTDTNEKDGIGKAVLKYCKDL